MLVILRQTVTFDNTVPMEIGNSYGLKFWQHVMKVQEEKEEDEDEEEEEDDGLGVEW